MKENEVIIVEIPKEKEIGIVDKAVKYSIKSVPFTYNRMNKIRMLYRINNIAKGKIAEGMLKCFLNENGILPNFEICTTPFYQADKKDFALNGKMWDQKNNYYHCNSLLYEGKYTNFPALVPNKFEKDQWSKRKDSNFLFTFIKEDDKTRKNPFLTITITKEMEDYLQRLYDYYGGKTQMKSPFGEEKFWARMKELGGENYYVLNESPKLIITGYAGEKEWLHFKNTGHYAKNDNFPLGWFYKNEYGITNFLDGTLCTKITNATCKISELPSFLSLFPQLKEGIKYGRLKE